MTDSNTVFVFLIDPRTYNFTTKENSLKKISAGILHVCKQLSIFFLSKVLVTLLHCFKKQPIVFFLQKKSWHSVKNITKRKKKTVTHGKKTQTNFSDTHTTPNDTKRFQTSHELLKTVC